MKISRRSLAKGLAAASTLAGFRGFLRAESSETALGQSSVAWRRIYPGVWRTTIGSPERFTPVSSRLVPAQVEAFAKLPKVEIAPLPAIGGKRTARGCVVQLPLRPNEQIYGMGLQFLSFAQRGEKKVVRVNADPKLDTGDSHAPVPFYVTTEGIGILIDTARYATFYFGDARPKPMHAIDSVKNASPDPNYTHNIQDGDTGQIVVEVPRARGVDIYLFGGPEMLDAVRRYNVFSGGGAVPPEWGLGFWYRMDARATQQSALVLAQEFRERKVPCDVIGLEPGWQTHAYSCTFAWNRDRFPDPEGFVRSAQEMNYKINLWEHAFIHPASPLFPEIEPHSADYGVWGGLVPDFAGEPARAAFAAYHAKTFLNAGVSGFKLDECDNSDYTGGWSFPECSAFPSGVDGEQMHNVFGLRYQMAIWNEFRKRGLPTYNLVRSSGTLAAPYPFVLYSDLYDHRQFVRALVNAGFCGLLWCPEVRDADSDEDLIRRLQTVVFSPLAMINGWYIRNPPWKQLDRKKNNANELATGWQELEARCREIVGWRMQLVPYLRAAFARYRADGTPPFRALVLDWPGPAFAKTDDAWMVGDRMLVAPLFAGERNGRTLTLPPGEWSDFWTGTSQPGDRTIEIAAETRNIPVFVKSGSVLPLATITNSTADKDSHSLSVRVFGDGHFPFEFETDSGAVRITWDARSASGSVKQSGTENYTVIRWS
jgi:alpha-D-xyloside xylohydrolase